MLSLMMSVWSFWNSLRCAGYLNDIQEHQPQPQLEDSFLRLSPIEPQTAMANTSSSRSKELASSPGVEPSTSESGGKMGVATTPTKSGEGSPPAKPVPKYAYKGKSVKSNSVGIVEISSVKHAVVGGRILCIGTNQHGLMASGVNKTGDVSGIADGTSLIKKVCTVQGSSSKPRRRSSSRICRICRKYRDGPRRHR